MFEPGPFIISQESCQSPPCFLPLLAQQESTIDRDVARTHKILSLCTTLKVEKSTTAEDSVDGSSSVMDMTRPDTRGNNLVSRLAEHKC